MSRANTVLGPIWSTHTLDIPVSTEFLNVDAFSSVTDFNANVFGEVQAYTQSTVSDTAGYLVLQYEIEFRRPIFQPHPSLIPISSGMGTQFNVSDVANPSSGGAVNWAATGPLISTFGAIYKVIMNADESTLLGGATLANYCKYTTTSNASTSTLSTVTSGPITILDGMILFIACRAPSGTYYVYGSLEDAASGLSGQLTYAGTYVGISSFEVNGYLVRFAEQSLAAPL